MKPTERAPLKSHVLDNLEQRAVLAEGGTRIPASMLMALIAEVRLARQAVIDASCGGCRNIGAHQRNCPQHPDYHPWKRLADAAESVGDSIGEPDLANTAWALAGRIRERAAERPWRR